MPDLGKGRIDRTRAMFRKAITLVSPGSRVRKELRDLAARLASADELRQHDMSRVMTLLEQLGEALQANQAELRHQLSQHHAWLERELDVQRQAIAALADDLERMRAAGRPKRLFISTGYFATAMAACITTQQDPDYDNYLLITLDREDARSNTQWAYSVYDGWAGVVTVPHTDYYERTDDSPELPFALYEFDVVFSPFPRMQTFVEQHFRAADYRHYEEGLASYLELLNADPANVKTRFYALSPTIVRDAPGIPVPIDAETFKTICVRNATSYRIPLLKSSRNVILIAAGLPRDVQADPIETLAPYNSLVRALVDKHFDVWIKPHPRVAVETVFAQSELARLGAKLLETDAPLIECVLARNQDKIAAIASAYSSTLMHALNVFDIPAFTVDLPPSDANRYMWKHLQDAALPNAKLLLDAQPETFRALARSHHNANLSWSPPPRNDDIPLDTTAQ